MKTRTMFAKTIRVRFKNSVKTEENPEMTSSCFNPVSKYFRFLKLLGGFPVAIGVGCLKFSKWEHFRFATYLLFAILSVNVFTCIGLILPNRNFFIYVDIFKVSK